MNHLVLHVKSVHAFVGVVMRLYHGLLSVPDYLIYQFGNLFQVVFETRVVG